MTLRCCLPAQRKLLRIRWMMRCYTTILFPGGVRLQEAFQAITDGDEGGFDTLSSSTCSQSLAPS